MLPDAAPMWWLWAVSYTLLFALLGIARFAALCLVAADAHSSVSIVFFISLLSVVTQSAFKMASSEPDVWPASALAMMSAIAARAVSMLALFVGAANGVDPVFLLLVEEVSLVTSERRSRVSQWFAIAMVSLTMAWAATWIATQELITPVALATMCTCAVGCRAASRHVHGIACDTHGTVIMTADVVVLVASISAARFLPDQAVDRGMANATVTLFAVAVCAVSRSWSKPTSDRWSYRPAQLAAAAIVSLLVLSAHMPWSAFRSACAVIAGMVAWFSNEVDEEATIVPTSRGVMHV
jgi:hypothetical protein